MDGLFYENGPYVFQEYTTNMVYNNYTWNMYANMLYFESPVGVGFSTYGGDTQNLQQNDAQSAADNLEALVYFFSEYPELNTNPFYIAGESYGGIYVPYLAANVLDYNANTKPKPAFTINLKGIIVGNGVVNWAVDVGNALPYFAWSHNLIGTNTYNMWVQGNCSAYAANMSQTCMMALDEINVQMTNINIYDVYRDCDYNPDGFRSKRLFSAWRRHYGLKDAVPCVDDYGLYTYLNNATVRAALNIPTTFTSTWEICSNIVNYTIDYNAGSYNFYASQLLKPTSGIRVWIYSGDTDAAVPTNGTMTWINMLGMKNTTAWREWGNGVWGQVAGYTVDFPQLTFVTIKGTGHMSIQWKRPQGQYMFQQFLLNNHLY
jgi:carboxypeptidase C (cathepsin A)